MLSRRLLPAVVLIAATVPCPAAEPRPVTVKVEKDQIEFRAGDELVARYHVGPKVAKPYLWPLTAPGGVVVTRAWPIEESGAITKDHPHQKSAWLLCHGDVIPEGLAAAEKSRNVDGVDFWAEGQGHGVIACVEVGQAAGNSVRTHNEWRTASGRKILDETRTIAVHDLGHARLVVVSSDLHANAAPVVFGDTKEGSFGVRVHDNLRVGVRNMMNPKSQFTNAEGKRGEAACWGHPSDWVDFSGELDGKAVGVAVFDDSANAQRACWHARDYGLLAANPFGRAKSGFPAMKGRTDLVKLGKGEHLKLRYGIFVHSGDGATGKVAEGYTQFLKLRD